jgi:soluble lytic murein transglycosylase
MLNAPRDPARLYNVDEWWIERRLAARNMIDLGEYKTAYLIARDAALPTRDIYKTEQEFTAGWIALRFLRDPATAAQHFARIGVGSTNPTTLARAGYWQGRANRPVTMASLRARSSACRRSHYAVHQLRAGATSIVSRSCARCNCCMRWTSATSRSRSSPIWGRTVIRRR